jgi:hypothetical protein
VDVTDQWTLALLLTLLTGCHGEQATENDTGNGPDETCNDDRECEGWEICDEVQACSAGDRDNGFTEATPVFQVDSVDDPPSAMGYIAPSEDVDYFLYTSARAEWIEVRVRSSSIEEDGLDTVVTVRDSGGGLHAWMDDYATGTVQDWDSVVQVYLPSAGAWYITVEDRSTFYDDEEPRGGSDYAYELYLRRYGFTTGETDAQDDPSAEVDIPSGSLIYSVGVNLESAGDADWITVTLPWDDAPLEIYGQPEIPGSQAIAQVDLYDPEGTHLLSKTDLGPDGAASYLWGEAITYTARAGDAEDGGGPDHWYVLYFRSRNAGSGYDRELEPNDGFDDAQALDLEEVSSDGTPYHRGWVQARLDPALDEDWFAFDAAADTHLSVRCSAQSLGSLGSFAIDLVDPSGTTVTTAVDDADDDYDLLNHPVLSNAGRWAVRMSAHGEEPVYGPGAYYRCSTFITPFEVAGR